MAEQDVRAARLGRIDRLTAPVAGKSIPGAQEHLDFIPARLLAVLGNSLGTLARVGVRSETPSSSRAWPWPPREAA